MKDNHSKVIIDGDTETQQNTNHLSDIIRTDRACPVSSDKRISSNEIYSSPSRYPEYKDSGVKWLGEIPEHWEVISNKYIFKLKKILVGKRSSNYDLLSLTLNGIIKRIIEKGGKFPAEFDTYQKVMQGDFVFCLFDVEETPRTIGLSKFDGMITGAYTVMQPDINFNKTYLYYFYLNLDNKKRLKPLYKGLRNTIPKESFFAFKSFTPPLPEQTAIATYLDEKCEKIDKAIAQKQKLIELLKERKQIVIQNAVTGASTGSATGLASSATGSAASLTEPTASLTEPVEVKDSGIEWIGKIPKHWEVSKFKYIIRTKARLGWKGLKASEYVDNSNYKFLSTPNIKNEIIDFNSAYHITEYRYYESPEIMLEIGDVLLVKDGSTLGISNTIKYLPSKCTVNSSIAILRIINKGKLYNGYLNYFIKSKTLQNIIEIMKDGMGVPHLFQSDINNFSIPLPPLHEQHQIVTYIEKENGKTDKAIRIQGQQIEKLKEYKASLINSVVTGKVRVC
ncbi:MAG: restriction endonuclease subunit S [Hyphomicrobiales bacterium]